MNKSTISRYAILAAMLGLVLYGCGAGGSGSTQINGTGGSRQAVWGVAATGAAISGRITLKDSSSPPQVLTIVTKPGGNYSFDVTRLTGPFILRADWTDASGANQLYSITADPGVTNINPFSHVAYVVAAGASDPTALSASENQDPTAMRAMAARHKSATKDLQGKLDHLFRQYDTTKDPVHDDFEADHTGLDAMFDDVKITVSHGMIIITNKKTGAVIFTAPINDIDSGEVDDDNLPGGPGPLDGAALYNSNCSSCHGALATSSKQGSTAGQIQSAISRVSDMNSLSSLTAGEVLAIAKVLATTTAPPPVTDGAALYASNCSSCHGSLASSSKQGSTAAQIQSAISSNRGGMGSLSSLSTAQIQAIATALGTTPAPTPTPTPTDGAALYASNCGSCHGSLASSSKQGSTASQIQSAISSNRGGMGSLSSLSTAQIQAIATALGTTPAPTPTPTPIDGAALYASNCGSCHGSLASSSKQSSTASQIQSAISSNRGGMGSLSSLSTTQVQAIATALGTTPAPTPTPTPIDGVALYASNCSSCHGSLASSSERGATASQIQSAISSNRGGMGSLSSLTTAQIQAIATAL